MNDGGSAFPANFSKSHDCQTHAPSRGDESLAMQAMNLAGNARGMSLRDWFAGQALPALQNLYGPKQAAEHAFMFADAMIVERAKQDTKNG